MATSNHPNSPDQLPPQAPVYTPLPRKSTVFSKANMLMAGLFVAALVGLYLIHASSGPTKASAGTPDIDKQLIQFLKDFQLRDSQPDLIDTDQYDVRLRQLPPDDVRTDPFRYKPIDTPTVNGNTVVPDEAAVKLAKMREDALKRVEKVKIQSLSMGKEPAVLIENSLYTIGHTVAVDWLLTEISPYDIKLQWNGAPQVTYIVFLDGQDEEKKKK